MGTAVGVKVDGGLLDFVTREVHVECLPGDIPKHLEVDVTDLHIGQHVEAEDLKLPEGVDAARRAREGDRLGRPRPRPRRRGRRGHGRARGHQEGQGRGEGHALPHGRLILGLGNPGEEYRDTRHNVGFRVVEELARRWRLPSTGWSATPSRPDAASRAGRPPSCSPKPQTYMNRSGYAAHCFAERHELDAGGVLVVYDEVNLPLGKLRLRRAGSPAGHRGLEIDHREPAHRRGAPPAPRRRPGGGAPAARTWSISSSALRRGREGDRRGDDPPRRRRLRGVGAGGGGGGDARVQRVSSG